MNGVETEVAVDVDFRRPLANAEAEAAVQCAVRAARRLWIGQRAFRASISSIDSEVEVYQRALHQFERRTVSLHTAPGGSRHDLAPVPEPAAVDPWAVNPATIEAESRVSAICPTCNGSMRVTCDCCDGTTRARCGECNGSGKVYSQRKNQLYKNCPRCRGGGTVKCTNCRGGFVDCGRCAATGVITAWLSIECSMQMQVQVYPQNSASAVHVNVGSSSDFDSTQFPNVLTADTGTQAPTQSLPRPLAAVLNAQTDRLHTTRVQTFEGRVYHVCFANAVASGQVDVAGSPLAVASTSNWEPLRWRRSSAIWTALLGFLTVVVLRFVYVSQHEWYARFESGGVFGFGCVLALCLGWLVARLMQSSRARYGIGFFVAIASVLCSTTLMAAAYVRSRPSAVSARATLVRGNIDESRLEAQALIDLNLDRHDGELILDEIQAKLIDSVQTCHEIAPLLQRTWTSQALQTQSIDRLRSLAVSEAMSAFSRGDSAALNQLANDLAYALPSEAIGAHWRAAVLGACERIAKDRFNEAGRDLDDVATLAPNVPATMRLANFQQVIEAAALLHSSLVSVEGTNAHARKSALTAAVAQTDALVALLPYKWPQASTALAAELQKVRRYLARSERRAAAHEDDQPSEPANAPPAEAPARPSKDGLLTPY